MSLPAARASELLLPVKPVLIVASLIVALFLNLLPWPGAVLLLRPDFVALTLLYWCIHHPRKVGFWSAWFMGLIMDIADGAVLGEHALAYALLAYLAILLYRRVPMFGLRQQIWHVLPVLLLGQLAILFVKTYSGANFIGWGFFLSSVTGALLWPVISILLLLPQRPKPDPDEI
ncbi:MAG: rod shape-determining protein MreD [Burkholderiales bacterium]